MFKGDKNDFYNNLDLIFSLKEKGKQNKLSNKDKQDLKLSYEYLFSGSVLKVNDDGTLNIKRGNIIFISFSIKEIIV